MTLDRFRSRRASVLILALWALLLLSASVFAWIKFIHQGIAMTADRNNGLTAKALAHSGVMVALHPQVDQQTPLLVRQISSTRGYKVQMTGEGGRLNLNWIFSPADNPGSHEDRPDAALSGEAGAQSPAAAPA